MFYVIYNNKIKISIIYKYYLLLTQILYSVNKLFTFIPNDFGKIEHEVYITNYLFDESFIKSRTFHEIMIKIITCFRNLKLKFEQVTFTQEIILIMSRLERSIKTELLK